MNIGMVIREIREAQKSTLEEIAFAADTNASNLSRIERGKQGYSQDSLTRIATALGVTVSELHRRLEESVAVAEQSRNSVNAKKSRPPDVAGATARYSALSPDHRELVDDFMVMLLNRQRRILK
jgi:transcriptional regulator with XRE-family HTH domain